MFRDLGHFHYVKDEHDDKNNNVWIFLGLNQIMYAKHTTPMEQSI